MHSLLYIVARTLIACIQALPLRTVARLGRAGGGIYYWLDARHRRVAQRHVAMCFPEKSEREVRELVKENIRRIGENFVCAAKTASMTFEELRPHVEFVGPQDLLAPASRRDLPNKVFAIGHFGN